MNIGIDIDGVLVEYFPFIYNKGIELCKEFGIKIKNPNEYDLQDIFDWNKDVVKLYVDRYEKERVSKPAFKYASELTHKLHNQGHKIFIVTARHNNDGFYPENDVLTIEEQTLNWLKENNIYYDKIHFCSRNKLEVCQKNNIDMMIEDAPKNIRPLIDGKINTIIFDAPYNRLEEFKELPRATTWKEVGQLLNLK